MYSTHASYTLTIIIFFIEKLYSRIYKDKIDKHKRLFHLFWKKNCKIRLNETVTVKEQTFL